MTNKPRIQANVDGSYKLDAWMNSASGMGIAGIDKAINSRFSYAASRIDWITLSLMYRYDWLARKICERPAMDATRRGITIKSDNQKAIITELERLGFKNKSKSAISWSRLYGGAALLVIVEDGMTPADPLNPAKVKKFIDLRVIDRHNLQSTGLIQDPYAVNFQEPEYYTTNNGTVFHSSRVLKFNGATLTQDQRETEQYWGGSYVELYNDAVKQFQSSTQDIRHVMSEQSLGVLKIPDLTNSAAMGGDIFNAIQKRLDKFNLSKSIYRTAAMDKEEEFDFVTRQLSGLSELLDRFMTIIAGATEMGELVLFGTSPSGLNASQEEQLAVYYDMVSGVREGDLMQATNTVLSCINKGVIPEWEYNPLQEQTEAAKADTRLKEAQTMQAVADIAGLMPEAVVDHLNKTGLFDLPTTGLIDPNEDEFL
jgi:hypothetical protein